MAAFRFSGGTLNLPTELVSRGPFDDLDPTALEVALDRWCMTRCVAPLPSEQVDLYFNTVSPRSTFFKNCPENARLLDMGAGNGALAVYKRWPAISRPDMELYGVSLDPIENSASYTAVSISNFETSPQPFGDVRFDAVIASHFIEHLSDPRPFLAWAASSLSSGGRMYLEWPHPFSKRMPTRSFFTERGIPLFTTRFDDDSTHVEAWPVDTMSAIADEVGLVTETYGRIVLPYLASQLRDLARDMEDNVRGTFALWLTVGWPQFLILRKA